MLRAQALSALQTPALQYIATIAGLHTLTEAVHLAALPLFGLIRHEHCFAPLFYRMVNRASLPDVVYYPGNTHKIWSKRPISGRFRPLPV